MQDKNVEVSLSQRKERPFSYLDLVVPKECRSFDAYACLRDDKFASLALLN